jgi:hypothetical protein
LEARPPSIEGTPAGGAFFTGFLAAEAPLLAAGAAFLAGFLAAFLAGFLEDFLAEERFFALFFAVLPAAFLVVFVFFAAGFFAADFFALFLAAIFVSSCKRNVTPPIWSPTSGVNENLTRDEGEISTSMESAFF